MSREELVNKVEDLVSNWPTGGSYQVAEAILDAILPQVGTVDELEALPVGSVLGLGVYVWIILDSGAVAINGDGRLQAHYNRRSVLQNLGATLIWTPDAEL
jgi:hypothetical protein